MCSSSISLHDTSDIESPELLEPTEYSGESCSLQRQVRSLILHLLYAMDSYEYDVSLAAIIDSLNRGFDTNIDLEGEIAQQAQAVIDDRHRLDETIKPLLANWRLERIGLCTRLILRMAAWELLHSAIGPKIIINEAIELAKCFSERDAYKFINGVLDELLKRIDAQRMQSGEDSN